MKLFNPKNYIRLFSFTNVPLLLDYFYLEPKIENRILAVNAKKQRTVYLPKDEFERTKKIGLLLYEKKEKAQRFEKELREAGEKFLKISKNLDKKNIFFEDFSFFKKSFVDFYRLYDKTDFLYTDLAYEKGVIKKNLPEFGKLKEEMREIINKILFGEDGLLYKSLRRISKQFNLNYDRLLFYTPYEFEIIFKGKRINDSICETRKVYYVVYSDGRELLLHEDAKMIAKDFFIKKSNIIKGITASKGYAKGRVVVFPDNVTSFTSLNQAFSRIQQGDILVAETTSPEIMPACSKAGAIVTNQGGLISHAAIISRELKIPCVVGTENATSLLSDGDEVEVNADKGQVRIIKKVL